MPEAQIFTRPPARLFNSYAARSLQENMDASLIAATEFNWREAAKESERRIIANHYSPKVPPARHKLIARPHNIGKINL